MVHLIIREAWSLFNYLKNIALLSKFSIFGSIESTDGILSGKRDRFIRNQAVFWDG
jgi:hypothetical protein